VPVATSDVIDWLTGLGWDTTQETGCPLYAGPYVPPEPDQICVITPTPGPGFQMEGAADMCAFQARVRGPQGGDGGPHAQAAAETIAYALDALIFSAPFPSVLASGKTLSIVTRLGGQPSPLASDPDDGSRFSLVASYLIEVSN
jgi:hypothetical protein